MDRNRPRWWRNEQGINVEVQFPPEIHIDVKFDLTTEEYNTHISVIKDNRITRVQTIARLYFAKKKTIREIAVIVKISKSQVHKDLKIYRNSVLGNVKGDITSNGRALSLLVELKEQSDDRMQLLWNEHQRLEELIQVLGFGLKKTYQKISRNQNPRIRNIDKHKDLAKEIRILTDAKRNILSQLRSESQQLLNTFGSFGLCGPEAMTLVSTGENEAQKRVETTVDLTRRMVCVVKDMVSDETTRRAIFGRMAKDIKESGLREWHFEYKREECDEILGL